ncbi:hypothetical protein [uncultured Paraglaciecola sp.]|uniref:hypothetical protein n=1 Tax=uncultured Paraglaciecola sp. TaxID=1765024 RepID=UPI0026093CF4|nr:hypothetical protein [uncultured Paraglaciecola sp.]
MQLSVTGDIKKATRLLGAMKKQIPFAASVAMNDTATDIQKVEKSAMHRELDNPRPATVKGIRVSRSNKRSLSASVFILPAINQFIRYQVVGGVRPPRSRTEAVPFNMRLNKYGNIPGRRQGKLAKILAKPDTFSGTIKGVAGIWQRGKGRNRTSLTLLVAYENKTTYRPAFHFYRHAERTAASRWPRNFSRAIKHAIRTAR